MQLGNAEYSKYTVLCLPATQQKKKQFNYIQCDTMTCARFKSDNSAVSFLKGTSCFCLTIIIIILN